MKRTLALLAGIQVAYILSGCGPVSHLNVAPPTVLEESRSTPVEITWRLPEKTPVEYLFRCSMRVKGKSSLKETREGIIRLTNLGKMGDNFFKLHVSGRETYRKKVEVDRGRQIIETNPRPVVPAISPNTIKDPSDPALIQYPVDPYWRFGLREQSPFHYFIYYAPTYLLPAFTPQKLSAGDEWTVRIPVIIGNRYMNNEFTLTCRHRLERFVSLPNGHDAAEISFTMEGSFDTSAEPFAKRFPDSFRSSRRIEQAVSGSGRALFDLAMGLLVWKEMSFKVVATSGREKIERDLARKVSKTLWETETYEWDATAVWRLRQPGEPIPIR